MRKSKFHFLRAENVLCFGPAGIEIHFDDFGGVVHVRGVNLDNPACDGVPASNGAGKSSVAELLSIVLYGRTIKSPTKLKGSAIINVLASRGEAEVRWDDCRVVRSFKKSKAGTVTGVLRAWQSADRLWDKDWEVSKGASNFDTQAWIEAKVGLSHDAFCSVAVFDDSDEYCFLNVETEDKRGIVENLLELAQYRQYHENAKNELKEAKRSVLYASEAYARLRREADDCDRRIASLSQQEQAWRDGWAKKITELEAVLERKRAAVAADEGAKLAEWEAAQGKVAALGVEVADLEGKRAKVVAAVSSARLKIDAARADKQAAFQSVAAHNLAVQEAEAECLKMSKLVERLESLEVGAKCPTCHGVVNPANYGQVLEHARTQAERHKSVASGERAAAAADRSSYDDRVVALSVMEGKVLEVQGRTNLMDARAQACRAEIKVLSAVSRPEAGEAERVRLSQIADAEARIKAERDGCVSPYGVTMAQFVAERDAKVLEAEAKGLELKALEAEVPYIEYWEVAFGDDGIRKFVIDGVIPSLNEWVAYWLQCLIDGRIAVEFDNKLEAKITRNGNPVRYHGMSKAEKRRVNLSVSQAFAYVTMLSAGICPGVVFLDEITGGSIDRAGVVGVYNMVLELAKERQVFVTTHNDALMSLLGGCDTITVKKHHDVAVIERAA